MSSSPANWQTIHNLGVDIGDQIQSVLDGLDNFLSWVDNLVQWVQTALNYIAWLFKSLVDPVAATVKAVADQLKLYLKALISVGGGYIVIHPWNAINKRESTVGIVEDVYIKIPSLTPMEAFQEFNASFANTKDHYRPQWGQYTQTGAWGFLVTAPLPNDFIKTMTLLGSWFTDFSAFEKVATTYKDTVNQYAKELNTDMKKIHDNIIVEGSQLSVTNFSLGDEKPQVVKDIKDSNDNIRKLQVSLVNDLNAAESRAHWETFSPENLGILQEVLDACFRLVDFMLNVAKATEAAVLALIQAIIDKVKALVVLIHQVVDIIKQFASALATTGIYMFNISYESGGVQHLIDSLTASYSSPQIKAALNNQFSGLIVVAWGGLDNSAFTTNLSAILDKANEPALPSMAASISPGFSAHYARPTQLTYKVVTPPLSGVESSLFDLPVTYSWTCTPTDIGISPFSGKGSTSANTDISILLSTNGTWNFTTTVQKVTKGIYTVAAKKVFKNSFVVSDTPVDVPGFIAGDVPTFNVFQFKLTDLPAYSNANWINIVSTTYPGWRLADWNDLPIGNNLPLMLNAIGFTSEAFVSYNGAYTGAPYIDYTSISSIQTLNPSFDKPLYLHQTAVPGSQKKILMYNADSPGPYSSTTDSSSGVSGQYTIYIGNPPIPVRFSYDGRYKVSSSRIVGLCTGNDLTIKVSTLPCYIDVSMTKAFCIDVTEKYLGELHSSRMENDINEVGWLCIPSNPGLLPMVSAGTYQVNYLCALNNTWYQNNLTVVLSDSGLTGIC